jgi:ribulose-bisphosphate carboxylase large chain
MLDYIDLKYKPSVDKVIVDYNIKPHKNSISEIARNIAELSSISDWTTIFSSDIETAKKLKPTIFYIKNNHIKIAYPCNLFEYDNIPQIISTIKNNIFEIDKENDITIEDINFPKKIIDKFKGPAFGIQGIRKITNIKKRPFICTIIKPLSLNEKEYALNAKHAWLGGCDIVKDSENLTDLAFNRFKDRLIYTIDAKHKAENSTGEKKIFIPNITAETEEMIKRAKLVKDMGGTHIMIDVTSTGISALQTIRNLNSGLIINASLKQNQKDMFSIITLLKLTRLAGADEISIGNIFENKLSKINNPLEKRCWNLKSCFSVCEGNLNPTDIPGLIKLIGNNIIIQMNQGINDHPGGTLQGSMASKQALEAVIKKISLKNYSKSHSELRKALEKWSYDYKSR